MRLQFACEKTEVDLRTHRITDTVSISFAKNVVLIYIILDGIPHNICWKDYWKWNVPWLCTRLRKRSLALLRTNGTLWNDFYASCKCLKSALRPWASQIRASLKSSTQFACCNDFSRRTMERQTVVCEDLERTTVESIINSIWIHANGLNGQKLPAGHCCWSQIQVEVSREWIADCHDPRNQSWRKKTSTFVIKYINAKETLDPYGRSYTIRYLQKKFQNLLLLKNACTEKLTEEFNNYFLTFGENTIQQLAVGNNIQPYIGQTQVASNHRMPELFEFKAISQEDVSHIITSMPTNKSPAPDKVNMRAIKDASPYILTALTNIIILCWHLRIRKHGSWQKS